MSHDPITRRQERRMSLIQSASFAVSVGGPVLFGCLLVSGSAPAFSAYAGAGAAVIAAAVMFGVFTTNPPPVVPAPEQSADEPSWKAFIAEDPADASGWDFLGLVIAAGAIIAFLVVTVLRFIVPLSIIGMFWFANGAEPTLAALGAAGLSLAVMCLMEFGVEVPLCRRWGLPYGESTPPLTAACPVPRDEGP